MALFTTSSLRRTLEKSGLFSTRYPLEIYGLIGTADYDTYIIKDVSKPAVMAKVRARETSPGLSKEALILKTLNEVPYTPAYVGFLEEQGEGILLTELIEGRALDFDKDYLKAAMIFGRLQKEGQIEGLEAVANPLESVLESSEARLHSVMKAGILSVEHMDFFERLLEWLHDELPKRKNYFDGKLVLTHNRLDPLDFQIGSSPYLTNFQYANLNDPAVDLARFLSRSSAYWYGHMSLKAIEKDDFFYLYEKHLGEKRTHIERRVKAYMPYQLLEFFSLLVMDFYRQRDSRIPLDDPREYERLKGFLELDVMKRMYIDAIE